MLFSGQRDKVKLRLFVAALAAVGSNVDLASPGEIAICRVLEIPAGRSSRRLPMPTGSGTVAGSVIFQEV